VGGIITTSLTRVQLDSGCRKNNDVLEFGSMPVDYQCDACNLAFQIGWYHYHRSIDGYWSATLGFCQKCGTIHKVEHASKGALPDRMFAQAGPLEITASPFKGVTYQISRQDWRPMNDLHSCGHCGANELLFETKRMRTTPKVTVCPRCGSSSIKELAFLVT